MMARGSRHKPDATTRAQVAALKSYGHTNKEIGRFLSICDDTLNFHYSNELATAVIHANAEVARRLFNRATKKDDLTAQIFWLKTRAGWRDNDKVENNDGKVLDEIMKLRDELAAKNQKEF
jgi:hypothetical protein